MSIIESPVRKVGRPTTRLLTRGRSNSLGNHPASPEIPTNITVPLTGGPVLDPPENVQPDRVEQPADANPVTPPPNPPDMDARDQPAPAAATAADASETPRTDPKQQANRQLRKQGQRIVDDCQEFLEIYEDLQLNSPLLNQLVSESNVLLTRISTCSDQLDDEAELTDVMRELKRWQRIIKTFVVSMLGKYEIPSATSAPRPAPDHVPQQSNRSRDKRDSSPDTLDLVHRDLVFFMSKLHDDIMTDVGLGSDVSNSELRDLHDITLPQITKAIDECRRTLKIYTSNAS